MNPGIIGVVLAAGLVAMLPKQTALAGEVAFGFTGTEIFPVDQVIGNLRCGDLDGDGLNDLVVANNARSKIVILYNRTGKPPETGPDRGKREINELPPDARFRIESIASEKRIADLVLADLNGDQKLDLAYFGDPKELVVLYNLGTNQWSSPKRFALEDGQLSPNCLAAGDIDGDKLVDLLLLGENALHVLVQKADHTLAEPEKLPFSGTIKSVQLLDIDGDGKEDLLLSNWDSSAPLRFRLQTQDGRFGPETYFEMPPIRSYLADDLDGDRKTEVITIAQNSGRAQIYKFGQKPGEKLAAGLALGQLQILPLNRTSKARRGTAWGDANGDGRTDLLVAEPDTGQINVHLQQPDGSLGTGKTFPTLTGVSVIEMADWNADGTPEIFLLSVDERQVGVTRYDTNGRVAFPSLVSFEGKPLAIATGRLTRDKKTVLAMIIDRDGKRELLLRAADDSVTTHKLSEDFKANPSSMSFHDVDQDGLNDLVVLVPYDKIKILRQKDAGDFEELDVAPPGGSAEQPWLASADVDGDGPAELLLAQKNFLRAVTLKAEPARNGGAPSWNFAVKDQINGVGGNSRIVGATALTRENEPVPTIFLLDAERKVLTLCERDKSGVWQAIRNQRLPFTDFTELQAVALGSKKANSISLIGLNTVAWLPLGGQVWEMKELDGYETPVKDGRLHDVVCGDLNGDGRRDLVFLETARNYLDIVIFDPKGNLVPANRWPVFEERTFRGRRGDTPEPREAVIKDFTGDGKNDLVIVVHDRLLLYPQE